MTEPASIRYNNPGAMWGRLGKRLSADREVETNYPLAMRWGSTKTVYLSDGLGQGNNAAVFPTKVQGAAAQLDLWKSKYAGLSLAGAIKVWSGGNSDPEYASFLRAQTGIDLTDRISESLLAGPKGLALMKAQAAWECGRIHEGYPMSDAEWQQAQNLVFPGTNPAPTPDIPKPEPAPTVASSFWSALLSLLLFIFKRK